MLLISVVFTINANSENIGFGKSAIVSCIDTRSNNSSKYILIDHTHTHTLSLYGNNREKGKKKRKKGKQIETPAAIKKSLSLKCFNNFKHEKKKDFSSIFQCCPNSLHSYLYTPANRHGCISNT